MSNIPKSRRKATSLDALALAQNIRSEITTELMLTFGYSEKRLEQHIRKVTDYIQDDALRERAAAQLRETNQDFSMWFIEKERPLLIMQFHARIKQCARRCANRKNRQ